MQNSGTTELNEPKENISYLLMTTRSQVLTGSSPYTTALKEILELSGYQDLLTQPSDIELTGTFSGSLSSEKFTIHFLWMDEDICLGISRHRDAGQREQRTYHAPMTGLFTFWKPVICLFAAMSLFWSVVLMSLSKV